MKTLLLIASLFPSLLTMACDCGYNGPFLKSAKQTQLVVLIKVTGYSRFSDLSKTPLAMELEILEVLRGKEKRKTITVWGDTGHLCRPFVTRFEKDSVYLMAVNIGNERWGQKKESRKDYSISNCGAFWLKAADQMRAVGDVNGTNMSIEVISIKELKSELLRNSR